MEEKKTELINIYEAFETETNLYRKDAACHQGCAYCCKAAGSIDITTLEGLIIYDKIKNLNRPQQVKVIKLLSKDMKKHEKGEISACPFLMKNKACMVYELRPFSCRRIYSLHICSKDKPPVLNRQVMKKATHTLEALQRLDDIGYTGHLSYILYMLENPTFYATYTKGEFKPEEVTDFGKTHKIVINKKMI